jgi:hypothetical protein
MYKVITAADFYEATHGWPEGDDLQRANCKHRGPAHWGCGWDDEANLPNWLVQKLIAEHPQCQ